MLALAVGLGKTVITCYALAVLLQQRKCRYILIVLPKSIINQWKQAIQDWIGQGIKIVVFTGTNRNLKEQIGTAKQAIVLTTYQTAAKDFQKINSDMIQINETVIHSENRAYQQYEQQIKETQSKQSTQQFNILQSLKSNGIDLEDSSDKITFTSDSEQEQQEQIQQQPIKSFLNYNFECAFDITICDECQALKNSSTDNYNNIKKISSLFRIGLSGTPLMNKIKELYNLISFLDPLYLGMTTDFQNNVEKAISAGRVKNAFFQERVRGKVYEKMLANELNPIMIRRTEDEVHNLKIDKTEIIIWFNMADLQNKIYLAFNDSKQFKENRNMALDYNQMPFEQINTLRKCCENIMKLNEKDSEYLDENIRKEFLEKQLEYINKIKDNISISEFLNDKQYNVKKALTNFDETTTTNSDDDIVTNDDLTSQHITSPTTSKTNYQKAIEQFMKEYQAQGNNPDNLETSQKLLHDLHKSYSTKQYLLIEMLLQFKREKSKVLLFTEHTVMLDLIQMELQECNIDFCRLDGSITKDIERAALCKQFNEDQTKTVFLMTIGCGSTGLNLQAANKVIIFSPQWTPSVEDQAVGRAYRIGQQRDITVYKFIGRNTIEERMLARQFHKMQLSNATMGGQQINIKATNDDIKSLFQIRDPKFEQLSDNDKLKKINNIEKKIAQLQKEVHNLVEQEQIVPKYMSSQTTQDNFQDEPLYLKFIQSQQNVQQMMLNPEYTRLENQLYYVQNELVKQQQRLKNYQRLYDTLEKQLNICIPYKQNCPKEPRELIERLNQQNQEYQIKGSILRTTYPVINSGDNRSQEEIKQQKEMDLEVTETLKKIEEIDNMRESQVTDQKQTIAQLSMKFNQLGQYEATDYRTIKQIRQYAFENQSRIIEERKQKRKTTKDRAPRIIQGLQDVLDQKGITKQNVVNEAKKAAGEKITENQPRKVKNTQKQSQTQSNHKKASKARTYDFTQDDEDQLSSFNSQNNISSLFSNTDNEWSSSSEIYQPKKKQLPKPRINQRQRFIQQQIQKDQEMQSLNSSTNQYYDLSDLVDSTEQSAQIYQPQQQNEDDIIDISDSS